MSEDEQLIVWQSQWVLRFIEREVARDVYAGMTNADLIVRIASLKAEVKRLHQKLNKKHMECENLKFSLSLERSKK
jgi:uncharacterized small protein (DUF1192 family)